MKRAFESSRRALPTASGASSTSLTPNPSGAKTRTSNAARAITVGSVGSWRRVIRSGGSGEDRAVVVADRAIRSRGLHEQEARRTQLLVLLLRHQALATLAALVSGADLELVVVIVVIVVVIGDEAILQDLVEILLDIVVVDQVVVVIVVVIVLALLALGPRRLVGGIVIVIISSSSSTTIIVIVVIVDDDEVLVELLDIGVLDFFVFVALFVFFDVVLDVVVSHVGRGRSIVVSPADNPCERRVGPAEHTQPHAERRRATL